MRVSDLIRNILDLIDNAESNDSVGQLSPLSVAHEEPNHDKQIADLLPVATHREYANEPNEQYADINAVTVDAGGGVNGPKHPSDIRGEHASMYPAYQAEVEPEKEPKQGLHGILIQMMRDL